MVAIFLSPFVWLFFFGVKLLFYDMSRYHIFFLSKSFLYFQFSFRMPTIRLQSSDGEVFDTDEQIAKCSGTIKTMLEGKFLVIK